MSTSITLAPSQSIYDRSWTPPSKPLSFTDYVAGFMFEAFLYGINTVLFSLSVYILVHKSKACMRWRLLVATMAMFALTTINTSLSAYSLFGLLVSGLPIPERLVQTKLILSVYSNVIADVLLISRCFAAWSCSRRIILLPSIGLLAASIYGTYDVFGSNAPVTARKYNYLWFSLSLNTSVAALTAGRLWWMARKARKILGKALTRKYYSAIAIVIESGAIYSLYILVDQTTQSLMSGPFFVHIGVAQVVFTAPLLLVVQIGLGRHIRDVDTTIQHSRGASVALSPVH